MVSIFSDGSDIYAVINCYVTKAQMAVYSLSGVCIARVNSLDEGQNKITVEYNPGIYIVKLVLDSELFTQKVIIK
jgi:hypothetical protein